MSRCFHTTLSCEQSRMFDQKHVGTISCVSNTIQQSAPPHFSMILLLDWGLADIWSLWRSFLHLMVYN